jgi:hypothetical protein
MGAEHWGTLGNTVILTVGVRREFAAVLAAERALFGGWYRYSNTNQSVEFFPRLILLPKDAPPLFSHKIIFLTPFIFSCFLKILLGPLIFNFLKSLRSLLFNWI